MKVFLATKCSVNNGSRGGLTAGQCLINSELKKLNDSTATLTTTKKTALGWTAAESDMTTKLGLAATAYVTWLDEVQKGKDLTAMASDSVKTALDTAVSTALATKNTKTTEKGTAQTNYDNAVKYLGHAQFLQTRKSEAVTAAQAVLAPLTDAKAVAVAAHTAATDAKAAEETKKSAAETARSALKALLDIAKRRALRAS